MMQSFQVTKRKDFMNTLLKSDLFDTFEAREIIAHVAFKMHFDCKRNIEYFQDVNNDPDVTYTEYLSWAEIRKLVYELMIGKKMPLYFKIILSTNKEKTLQLSPDVSTFYLNITFKDNQITCTTGTAYAGFTMDKSAEQIWDKRIQQFLLKYDFI